MYIICCCIKRCAVGGLSVCLCSMLSSLTSTHVNSERRQVAPGALLMHKSAAPAPAAAAGLVRRRHGAATAGAASQSADDEEMCSNNQFPTNFSTVIANDPPPPPQSLTRPVNNVQLSHRPLTPARVRDVHSPCSLCLSYNVLSSLLIEDILLDSPMIAAV